MILSFVSLLFVVVCMVLFRRMGVQNPFSKGVALALGLSLLAAICLAQNYMQSLIFEVNDGIGISNPVAYGVIGEGPWSTDRFRVVFERSIYITIALFVVYPVVVLLESRRR